jgi:hypothetical protein
MSHTLVIIAIFAAGLSLGFLVAAITAIRRRQIMGSSFSVLLALLFLTLSALAATITVATQGYRALTREEVAATVVVDRLTPTHFRAVFAFPDGRTETYMLAGDEFYVDAHILKWKAVANLIGLHTTYELDRVAGRYMDVGEEQTRKRTVFDLSKGKRMDMYDLRSRFPLFKPLVDAEYGSATFVSVKDKAEFEVRVSTTGLLIRKVWGS